MPRFPIYPINTTTLERFNSSEARVRRLAQYRKRLEVKTKPLSPANDFHLSKLKDFEVKINKELEARRRELYEHQDKGTIRDPAGVKARLRFFQLLQQKSALQQAAANAKRASNTKQTLVVNRRSFFPFPTTFNARTLFGTDAHVWRSRTDRPQYRSAGIVVPCIQRAVRRQVMFALGHGGRGHRVRHRFGPQSMIGC